MSVEDEAREALAVDDHAFQGVVTKLRTTKGSAFALGVMSEAADRIEALTEALRALLDSRPVTADEQEVLNPYWQNAIDELADAIRLTVEYVGTDMLPPIQGWSWFDALLKHHPDMLEGFQGWRHAEPRPVTAQPNEREARASEFVEILNAVWHHQQDVLGAAHKIATRLSPAALTQSEVVEWEYGCRSSVHRLNADRGGVPLPWGVEPAEHGETCPSPSLARRQKAGPWLALEAVAPSPTDHTNGSGA